MNKRDKDKLFILLVLIIYIAVTTAMIRMTALIPWQWLIAIIVMLEYFVVQPRICKLYYRVNGSTASLTRFIPFWNEIMMFKSSDALASLFSYVLLALSVIALYVPSEVVAVTLGEKVMFNYGTAIIRVIAILLIVNCIIVGVSFSHVLNKIKKFHMEFSGGKLYAFNVFYYVLLFFPLLRMVSLINMMNVLIKLAQLNNFTVTQTTTNDLVEEN